MPRSNDIKEQVGARLRAVRLVMGLEQEPFGRLMGVSGNVVGNWERGEKLASVIALTKLELKYKWPLNWFFAGQLGNIGDYEKIRQLEEMAGEVGAVVGAPTAEFPNEVPTDEEGQTLRPPGSRARRKSPARTLHEPKH